MSGFHVDQRQVRHTFARAAASYEQHDVLQREVQDLLLDRLAFARSKPERILDVGAGTGRGTALLAKRYPKARTIALDHALPMLHAARRQQRWRRRFDRIAGDASHLPFADDTVDLLHSNLCVQWIDDLEALFAEWVRVLRPGALVAFSTFGPDTLRELRECWAEVDAEMPHVGVFLDLHDIGDRMLAAGLRDPVLDVTRYTLTYDQPRAVVQELKGLGATNAARNRSRGLTGKHRFADMLSAYERRRINGRIPATWEVITAHAFGPEPGQPRRTAEGGEIATFSVDALRKSRQARAAGA